MPDQPLFKHDCDNCTFLGTFTDEDGREYDGWAHYRHRGFALQLDTSEIWVEGPLGYIEVIRRWSDDGPDYGCMSFYVTDEKPHPAYAELTAIAIALYAERVLSS